MRWVGVFNLRLSDLFHVEIASLFITVPQFYGYRVASNTSVLIGEHDFKQEISNAAVTDHQFTAEL
jgi:hypothetical protein